MVQPLPVREVLGRYPSGESDDAHCCAQDLLRRLLIRRHLLRMSLVAHDIATEREDSELMEPHRWVEL